MLVVLDGRPAVGCTTIAKLITHEGRGFSYVDVGVCKRAIASLALEHGVKPLEAAAMLDHKSLYRGDLNSHRVNEILPEICASAEVHRALVDFIRLYTKRGKWVIAGHSWAHEFPEAEAKCFLEATPETRMWRRYRQHLADGRPTSISLATRDIALADERAKNHPFAPLRDDRLAYHCVVDTNRHKTPRQTLHDLLRYEFPRRAILL